MESPRGPGAKLAKIYGKIKGKAARPPAFPRKRVKSPKTSIFRDLLLYVDDGPGRAGNSLATGRGRYSLVIIHRKNYMALKEPGATDVSGKDVREFLYTNMRAQRRYETDDGVVPTRSDFDSQKDDRVLLLLNQLGERLIRSERERLEMKETVGRYSDLISALENKIDRQAVAEEELRLRQEKIERDYAAQMERMEKAVLLAERIEEAINQQNRLARRMDQITQDKARMLRKLERIEEAVVETQTALNSKSLVLVSDQNRAVNDPSARIPRPANENGGLWQNGIIRRLASTSAVFVLIAALSWGVYQSIPESRFSRSELEPVTAENLLATPPFTPENAPDVRNLASSDSDTDSPYTRSVEDTVENLIASQESNQENDFTADTSAETATEAPVAVEEAALMAPSVTESEDILAKSDDELVAMLNDDPDALATALNNIAPSAAGMPRAIEANPAEATPAPVVAKTPTHDTSSDDFLRAQNDSRPLAQRIQPDPNLPAALKDVEVKAFQGVPEAQHDLAAIYTAGHGGVKTDFARAALWFEEAALNNIPNARYNLGVLYHQGLGVSQDTAKAINWYKAAAAQNHPEAQYNLGIAYIEGVGTEYSPKKAAANFESAARAGILEASYNLGLIYENGLLGAPEIENAIYWYNRAAEQGSPEGKAALNQLSKNMGYSEARIQDIYKKRKADIENDMRTQEAAAAPAVITPVSAPATTPVSAAPPDSDDVIPVLPLDGALSTPSLPTLVPASQKGAASSSTRDSSVIAQIQEQLMNYGLYPGPADGIYNDVMADAIRSYQKTNDLSADGRANEALLLHMLSQEMGSREE